jgi:hypothetical protein
MVLAQVLAERGKRGIRVGGIKDRINLGAVASKQQRGFANALAGVQSRESAAEQAVRAAQFFAHFDRRVMVAKTDQR